MNTYPLTPVTKSVNLPSRYATKQEAVDEILVLLCLRIPDPAPKPTREQRPCVACGREVMHTGEKAGRHKCQ